MHEYAVMGIPVPDRISRYGGSIASQLRFADQCQREKREKRVCQLTRCKWTGEAQFSPEAHSGPSCRCFRLLVLPEYTGNERLIAKKMLKKNNTSQKERLSSGKGGEGNRHIESMDGCILYARRGIRTSVSLNY